MLPIIIVAVVAVAGAAAGAVTYNKKKRSQSPKKPAPGTPDRPESLGDFAVWGQPDTGKTTFISCLRGTIPPTDNKTQTSSIHRYSNFKLTGRDGRVYEIQELFDMPGGEDRLPKWLSEIESRQHIFYIISLARLDDPEYLRRVRSDIKHTANRLKEKTTGKCLHVIGAHLDNSKWKDFEPARVREMVLQDDALREIRERSGEGRGNFYTANLLDPQSASQLIEDILNDCRA